MVTLNDTLDSIMQLDSSSREMLLEILEKRQIEERRKEIAKNAEEAKADFKSKKIKATTAANVISILNTL
ncbi:MAG TPA: hypothetical protein VLI68_13155 [Hanamia sp.]|jgi:hypothetical protein|nr:hypothetical protein [Hanamia sp.]